MLKLKTEKKERNQNLRIEIIAIISIIIFSISICPITFQNDTYYAIKIGEHIMQNGIDMMDPFSWHENLSYVYPHWGYDLVTYLIYNLGGLKGIYIVTCLLSSILGILIYYTNRKLAKNNLISFLIAIGAMYLLKGYITARAQLVTYILFMATIYLIEKYIEKRKSRYAVGLIIIPIILANTHIAVWPFYFVLYLPYIGEYIIAVLADMILNCTVRRKYLQIRIKKLTKKGNKTQKVEKLKEKLQEIEKIVEKTKSKREEAKKNPYKIIITRNENVKWLIFLMIICAFTGLITPLEGEPYTYLIKTMQGNTTQNINEHLPLTLINNIPILSVITIFIAMITFTKSKIKLADLFMIGGLTFLMLMSRRQSAIFVLIGSIIFNRLLTYLLTEYYSGAIGEMTKAVTTKIGMIVTIIIVILISGHIHRPIKDDDYIDKTVYPIQACDWIIENLNYKETKFYNEYNYGSYMLFRGIPVFIDSRADLYAPEFNTETEDISDGRNIFSDFIDTSSIGTFYGDIFKKYEMTHIITYKNSKVNMLITKTDKGNYKKLYSDDYFVIYEIVSYE